MLLRWNMRLHEETVPLQYPVTQTLEGPQSLGYSRDMRGLSPVFCWCSVCFAIRLGDFLGRLLRRVAVKLFVSAQCFLHSSGLVRINRFPPASSECLIAFWLALLWLPALLFAAIRSPEQFLHWPAMLAIGILFIALLLGPFAATPWPFKTLAKLAISICFLKSLWLLLNSVEMWASLAPFGLTRNYAGFALMMAGIFVWFIFVLRVIFSREPSPRAIAACCVSHRPDSCSSPFFPESHRSELVNGTLDPF